MKMIFTISFIFASTFSFSQTRLDSLNFLALVENHKIFLDEFSARYKNYLIFTGVQDNFLLRSSVLNNMINEILLKDYDNNKEIFSNSEYKKEIRWAKNETTLAFLKDREIYANIFVSEGEIREAFKRSNIKLEVRHLYASTKEKAENLYHLLKLGVSFNELAKQVFTDSTLKNNGGYLGYITWNQTDPGFEDAAYSLKIGEISKPIKTAQGYSIIKLENRIENPLVTENKFLNMKNKIERALKISKKKTYEDAYLKKIFGDDKIKFNDKSLQNILNYLNKDKDHDGFQELNNNSQKISYKNCVVFQDRIYSQIQIEKKLSQAPEYNLTKLTSLEKIKEAVHGLLMQDKLLEIAKINGYDTVSFVTLAYKKIANDIFLNYKRVEILNNYEVSDSELYKYYNDNLALFSSEKEMNVQEIIVYDSNIVKELKQKLNDSNFGKFAKKYSLRKWSAENNGEMGLSRFSHFGVLKDTLWNTKLGDILGPLKIKKYYGFFKVLKKQGGSPLDFSLVKPQIIEAVKKEKISSIIKKHIDLLSEKVNIKINMDLLKNYNLNLSQKGLTGISKFKQRETL